MTDGFLGRWSRRKADAREGKPLPEPAAPLPVATEPPPAPDAQAPASVAGLAADQPVAPAPPPLSLDDVKTLTPASNFTPFMESGVAPEVRNAAMKKLFADPHYNVMDRLDTYIDDYSQPDPIPAAMLRQMVGAKFLNLFGGEEGPDTTVRDDADNPTARSVAQFGGTADQPTEEDPSQPAPVQTLASASAQEPGPPDHADTHLRLQPDHAAGAEGPRRGAS
ncbi:MAG: DUF3306 domain-containing protein [Rhodoferax sp.]|nr:DUF3306 domain-containing protein [Rhodoferax sp.]